MNSKVLAERLRTLEKIWVIYIEVDEKNWRNIYHLTKQWISISESVIHMSTKHANDLVSSLHKK